MTDERFDKLLQVMLEVKGSVDTLTQRVGGLEQKVDSLEQKVDNLEKGQKEINDKLDRLEDNIDLLAQRQWNNEKDIYRIKKTIGVE